MNQLGCAKIISLWQDSSASKTSSKGQTPTLTIYPCSKATSDAGTVIVLPGGGYQKLADHEGEPVALALNEKGFHAAVLKYRLAPEHKHPAMIDDGQRAVRLIKAHGHKWGINPG